MLEFDRHTWAVTGQKYPYEQDIAVVVVLTGISQSVARMENDIRLLEFMKEL